MAGAVVRTLAIGKKACLSSMWPRFDSRLVPCGLSLLLVFTLLQGFFFRVLQFSSLLQNQRFQIPFYLFIYLPVCDIYLFV